MTLSPAQKKEALEHYRKERTENDILCSELAWLKAWELATEAASVRQMVWLGLTGKPTIKWAPRDQIKDNPTQANPSPIRIYQAWEIERLQPDAIAFAKGQHHD